MINRNFLRFIPLLVVSAAFFTACSNHSDFSMPENNPEGNAEQSKAKAAYQEGFTKNYPNVTLNQEWDFSSQSDVVSLPASQTVSSAPLMRAASRRADGIPAVAKAADKYDVEMSTISWMRNQLADGKDNRSKGAPFYMHVPSTSFTIIPIYQGRASAKWDLHMVVNGIDYKLWSKHEDMELKSASNKEWHSTTLESTKEVDRCTDKATAIRGPQLECTNMPTGADMYFYLEITYRENKKLHSPGDQLSSLDGKMLSLTNCPRPSNISSEKQVIIVGCEDAKNGGDHDTNDLVFMIVGNPDVPETVNVTAATTVVQRRCVRYMIEDLGASDDFDFNDIVVDVEQTRQATPVFDSSKHLTGWTSESDYVQKATIRHLGGTLTFQLKIGDTLLPQHEGKMNVNPDESYDVAGWNPDTHNVSIFVEQKSSKGMYFNYIPFPKAGEAPMIIATNNNQEWMAERQNIPESWFIDYSKQ